MKRLIIISLVLLIALLGYLLFRSTTKLRVTHTKATASSTNGFTWYLGNQAGLTNPAKPMKITTTNANGETFTMYVGGVVMNGTNVVVSNLDFKMGPAKTK